jgi:glycosyltransferase involved in cell wall biosynthesis
MGRLSPEKRVDWLIQAYQNLQFDKPDTQNLKLIIAGGSSATPEYVKSLQDISRGNPKIIFTGYVTGTEKEELLSNAMIFSLPSHIEGSPVVLLEAKSYGICSLVSDIPPHLEILHEGIDGMLFNSDDLSDLTAKLKQLIDDPKRTETMGIQAQKALKHKPAWKDVAKKMLKVYQEIL